MRRTGPLAASAPLLLLAALAVVIGLGASTCTRTTATRGGVTLVRRSHTVDSSAATPPPGGGQSAATLVTAPCAPGEQVVSGGFQILTDLADPTALWSIAGNSKGEPVPGNPAVGGNGGSYPSDASGAPSPSPTAWTLRVNHPPRGASLTAFVECLSTPAGASAQVVTQTATVTTTGEYRLAATCPSGTLRTGGGFLTTNNPPDYLLGTVDGAFPDLSAKWVVHGSAVIDTIGNAKNPEGTTTLTVTSYAMCLSLPGARLAALSIASLAVPSRTAPSSSCGYGYPYGYNHPCIADSLANSSADCAQQHAPLLVGGGFSDLQTVGPAPTIVGPDNTVVAQFGATVALFGATVTDDDSRWLAQARTAETAPPGQRGGAATGFVYAICMIGPG